MFANAYKLATKFTHPVIISLRYYDNSVECGVGAYVNINDEGWIITAAHIVKPSRDNAKHLKEIATFYDQIQAIQQSSNLTAKQKRIKKMKPNLRWITKHSFWWGQDGVDIEDLYVFPQADIAIGRLKPFNKDTVENYPVFKDPSKEMNVGTSLCKLGYPFHRIGATYDERTGGFVLEKGAIPVPRFPIEGIYTRNYDAGKSKTGKFNLRFIEPSSPGLRGQSGGPIFDVNGVVWAIQSRTVNLPLGFSPKIKRDGKETEEHQFLNVGVGVHPELIVAYLRYRGGYHSDYLIIRLISS